MVHSEDFLVTEDLEAGDSMVEDSGSEEYDVLSTWM